VALGTGLHDLIATTSAVWPQCSMARRMNPEIDAYFFRGFAKEFPHFWVDETMGK